MLDKRRWVEGLEPFKLIVGISSRVFASGQLALVCKICWFEAVIVTATV